MSDHYDSVDEAAPRLPIEIMNLMYETIRLLEERKSQINGDLAEQYAMVIFDMQKICAYYGDCVKG